MIVAGIQDNGYVIAAFITGVLGPVIITYIKHMYEKAKTQKPDIVKETLKISELVTTKIEEIREHYKADRAWITQFHNGGNFYPTGKSIAKFSVMFESVGLGVSSVQANFSNIPVNLFSKSLNEILSNDVIVIPDYKDPAIATFGLKYIAEDTGCKSGYLFAIKTIDDKFIGVLGLDYTKRKNKLDQNAISEIEISASSLGGVLMAHLEH